MDGYCLLHSRDTQKPVQEFVSLVQRILDGEESGLRMRGDLTAVEWHQGSLADLRWTAPAVLRHAHFHRDVRFGNAVFEHDVDFAGSDFIGGLDGGPVFQGNVSFEGSVLDFINLKNARFHRGANFRRIQYYSDSFIVDAEFRELADFSDSRNWELHFSRTTFQAGITFAGGSGRISFTSCEKARALVDVSGMRVLFRSLLLPGYSGAFRCVGTTFEHAVDLSNASLSESDFTGAWFQSDLNLSRTSFNGGASFSRVRADGAVDLSDSSVGGSGVLNFSDVSLLAPERLRFVRVNRASSVPLRLQIANTNIERCQLEDVHWWRERDRVCLQDEVAVAAGESSARSAMVAYRRLRTKFEATHLYEEAEDCVWGAMEMRRRDPSQSILVRATLFGYRSASYYGSSYQRALLVLLIMVFAAMPFGAASCGLAPAVAGSDLNDQIERWGEVHQHSVVEGVARHRMLEVQDAAINGSREYLKGLIYSLQVATFQDNRVYEPASVQGYVLGAVSRAAIPAQLGLLLLALRRRFTR